MVRCLWVTAERTGGAGGDVGSWWGCKTFSLVHEGKLRKRQAVHSIRPLFSTAAACEGQSVATVLPVRAGWGPKPCQDCRELQESSTDGQAGPLPRVPWRIRTSEGNAWAHPYLCIFRTEAVVWGCFPAGRDENPTGVGRKDLGQIRTWPGPPPPLLVASLSHVSSAFMFLSVTRVKSLYSNGIAPLGVQVIPTAPMLSSNLHENLPSSPWGPHGPGRRGPCEQTGQGAPPACRSRVRFLRS